MSNFAVFIELHSKTDRRVMVNVAQISTFALNDRKQDDHDLTEILFLHGWRFRVKESPDEIAHLISVAMAHRYNQFPPFPKELEMFLSALLLELHSQNPDAFAKLFPRKDGAK